MIDLFELGYVDSVGFAELLALLAEEFRPDPLRLVRLV
jgi:hypothetical protein